MGAVTTEPTTEERVRRAALVCIGRWGVAKTTLDDIVRESGVSRATIYRLFPGGKDVLIAAVLDDEADRFFRDLADALEGIDDLADKLVVGVTRAFELRGDHPALRAVLVFEPEVLHPELAPHHFEAVLERATAFIVPYLRPHVATEDDAEIEAEFIVRTVLSYAYSPSRRLDTARPGAIEALVRRFLVPAIGAPQPGSGSAPATINHNHHHEGNVQP